MQFELVKVAFYDCPLLVTNLSVVKDFILAADAHQGCSFLRYNVRTAHMRPDPPMHTVHDGV